MEPEILDAAIARLPRIIPAYTLVGNSYLEIVQAVNKGAAILPLAEKCGLSREQTMAIGDRK